MHFNYSMLRPKVEQTKETSRIPESCLLLPAAMPRGGVKPKASKKTNIHILVEFGLQVISVINLKKNTIWSLIFFKKFNLNCITV